MSYKSLVTGGAGFIGSNLVDELIRLGHEVIIVDDLSTGKIEYVNQAAKFYQADIQDKAKIEEIFVSESNLAPIDYVFHLAAQMDVRKSVEDPILDNSINAAGSMIVFQACLKNEVKKIIFSSTGGAVYGDTINIPTKESEMPYPVSPYGIHKLAAEKYLNYFYRIFGQDYTILRFANVYGPRQYKGGEAGVATIFIDNAVKGKPSIINGDGKQTRDFVYVSDIVRALILAAGISYQGEINIATGQEKDLLEIVRLINLTMGAEMIVSHGPAKAGEQLRSCLAIDRAKEIFAWQPEVSLEDGLKKTIDWSKRQLGL